MQSIVIMQSRWKRKRAAARRAACSGTSLLLPMAAWAALVTGAAALMTSSAAEAQEATVLTPTADAYVQDGSSSSTNFGGASTLVAKTSGPARIIYLRFALPSVAPISAAKLRLYGQHQGSVGTRSADTAYAVSSTTWSETGITWNNRPALGASLAVTPTTVGPRLLEWDVTSYLQARQAAGAAAVSLALVMGTAPEDNKPDVYQSRESDSQAPQLVLSASSGEAYQINFQPETSPIPDGFAADFGLPYEAGHGLGWVRQDSLGTSPHTPLNFSRNPRDRNQAGISPLLDTVMQMQYTGADRAASSTPGAWDMDLPNGTYSVTVSSGDKPSQSQGYNSTNTLNVNGTSAISRFVGSSTQPYKQATVQIPVTAGKLTVDAKGGINTKINYITIQPVQITPPAGPTTISWEALGDAPFPRSEAEGAVVGGKLYVFGGYYDRTSTPGGRSDVYDPSTDTWTQLPDMAEPATHAGTTTDGRYIYLAGGYLGPGGNSHQIFGTTHVWRYDPATAEWSALPPLPEARGAGSLVYFDGKLHFFGGANLSRVDQADHWVLPLGGTAWQSAAPLPTVRNHLGGVTLGRYIYVVGGEQGQDQAEVPVATVERYDPASDTWTEMASLPGPRSHVAAATFTLNNRIIVCGGETTYNNPISDVVAYEPLTNSWTTLSPLPGLRSSGVGAALDGKVFYTGGLKLLNTWMGTQSP